VNILILGGNRYFGKSVLKILSKKKNKIFLVNRGLKSNLKNKNIKHIKIDRKKINKDSKYFNNIYFHKVFDNNAYCLDDVKNLLSVIKNNFKHYIFTSSSITYLDLHLKKKVTENEWHKGKYSIDFVRKFKAREISYAKNKRAIEKFFINQKKINYTILRIPAVLGKNDFSSKTKNLIYFDYYKNFSKFNLQDKIQFIYKENLIRIIVKIIYDSNFKKKTINIANDPIKIQTFYKILDKNKRNKNKFLKNSEFPIPKNTTICNFKLKNMFKNLLTPTKKIVKKVLTSNEI
jgi:nucleoside-diphosphate-sugar epimerase